jgi:hypothetical protein
MQKRKTRSNRRDTTRKTQKDVKTPTPPGLSNIGSVNVAKQIREAEDEPIKCASPPCYLFQIEE